jgi:glutaredoxin
MSFRKIALSSIAVLVALAASSANAQLYKWVDANGKVSYSDTPPPPTAKRLDTKVSATSSGANVSNLPEDLAAATSKNPVTLYSSANCRPCSDGRTLLKTAGIPFAEKTVNTNEDIDKLKQVSGDTTLPALTIGGKKLTGFNSDEWRTALTSAGYPETNKLPKDYRYAAAEPAAPVAEKKEEAPKKRQAAPKPEPEPKIRF